MEYYKKTKEDINAELSTCKSKQRKLKQTIKQQAEAIEKLKEALKEAHCPNCKGYGTIVLKTKQNMPYGSSEPVKEIDCEWCAYREQALAKLDKEEK